jgi:hypothetical protein
MKYDNVSQQYIVDSNDVAKVKEEARYNAWPLALWLVAKHYAQPGSAKFKAVKSALAYECGHRGGMANAKKILAKQVVKEQLELPL